MIYSCILLIHSEDDKIGRRDRFHAGPIMDFKDKETFKPNVKLDYIDDNGRILNLKEAFRYLSHKFHGKGPGKNKIEKRLKKMEQDGVSLYKEASKLYRSLLNFLCLLCTADENYEFHGHAPLYADDAAAEAEGDQNSLCGA